MNVPNESMPSPMSPDEERITVGTRRLRDDTVATRLEIRRLESPLILAPDFTKLEDRAVAEGTAGATVRDALRSVVETVNRLQRRICRAWRSMTIPFPEPRVRLLPADQIRTFEATMNMFCEEFRQQAKQPPISSITMVTFGVRNLSGLLVAPANISAICSGSFGLRWDYPSLEPDPRLERLSLQLWQEEKERSWERFRQAAEEADASMVGEVMRMTNEALELLKDQSGDAAHRARGLRRIAEAFLRLERLNVARDGAVDLLFGEAHKILMKLAARGVPSGEMAERQAAAKVRWIQSELFAIRATSMYP